MTTLTKVEIIESIQTKLGFPKQKCSDLIEILMEIMKHNLENGENVLVSGFGKFCIKDKKERRGRNPSTGEDMMLSPRRVVTFKCSGVLRDKVNL